MSKDIQEALLIVFACLFSFLWAKSPLANFSLQLGGGLFLVYLFSRRFFRKTAFFPLSEALFLTTLILLLIFDTGGLSSPLFFLVYFLLFSLSFILEPQTAFILSLTMIILFIFNLKGPAQLANLVPLFSLPFITPLAVFFGTEHQKLKSTEKELAHDEKQTLLWLTTTFKEHLDNISEALQNIKNNNLTDQQEEALKAAAHHLKRLKNLGRKLKETVEGELKK